MGVKLSPLLLQFPAPDCMPSRWLSSKVKSSVHQSRDSARVLLASSLRIILIPFREQIVDFHVSVNTHISYAENPVRSRRQWPHVDPQWPSRNLGGLLGGSDPSYFPRPGVPLFPWHLPSWPCLGLMGEGQPPRLEDPSREWGHLHTDPNHFKGLTNTHSLAGS